MINLKVAALCSVCAIFAGIAGAKMIQTFLEKGQMQDKWLDYPMVMTNSQVKNDQRYRNGENGIERWGDEVNCRFYGGIWDKSGIRHKCHRPKAINRPVKIEGEEIKGIEGGKDAEELRKICFEKGGYIDRNMAYDGRNCKTPGIIIYPDDDFWLSSEKNGAKKINLESRTWKPEGAVQKLLVGIKKDLWNYPDLRDVGGGKWILLLSGGKLGKKYSGFPNHFGGIGVEDICSELGAGNEEEIGGKKDGGVFLYSGERMEMGSCKEKKLVNFIKK